MHHMLHLPGAIGAGVGVLLVGRNLQYLDIPPTSSLLYTSNGEQLISEATVICMPNTRMRGLGDGAWRNIEGSANR